MTISHQNNNEQQLKLAAETSVSCNHYSITAHRLEAVYMYRY